ncbi:aldose 1-epimerase family protein [Agromyces silvae]|uniref:aldose 1-epimerase family protein n=1 Tax=Agromyces silvae TaxID=3388266 RepID=UPI00280B4A76|nr:aldose 1-epimerase family protein [Agromyces protaetiae]
MSDRNAARDQVAPRDRIGSLAQVARVDSFIEAEGAACGARRLRLVNGGGLEIEVHPDRALDLGQVTVGGVPVAWISPTGITGPEAAEPFGSGWLRTFGGGMLATCGLDTFGPPAEDDGEVFGQHGRIGTQRATIVRAEADEAGVVVEGVVRQASVFGEHLVLRRRISSALGSDTVRIDDVVTNEAFHAQPHMVLYHFNLGWPLLGDRTTIDIPAERVTPRDADAAAGLGEHTVFGAPTPGFREQVFIHRLGTAEPVQVVVANPDNGLEWTLSVDGAQLPTVFQWKMAGQGHYALGIEPANTHHMAGRAAARAAGELPMLAAGESARYSVEFRLRRVDTVGEASVTEEAV